MDGTRGALAEGWVKTGPPPAVIFRFFGNSGFRGGFGVTGKGESGEVDDKLDGGVEKEVSSLEIFCGGLDNGDRDGDGAKDGTVWNLFVGESMLHETSRSNESELPRLTR